MVRRASGRVSQAAPLNQAALLISSFGGLFDVYEPIGIVLGAYQDKLVMHYALQNITNQVFVSHYQLYLPNREQLEAEFRRFMSGEAEKKDSE